MRSRRGHRQGDPLTRAEREILPLLAGGLTNKEIAERRWVAEQTVKFHVSNILVKLGVETRTAAAVAFERQQKAKTVLTCPHCHRDIGVALA